ncbi:unnamed protein product [Caenorhabditis angaria]|uniref:SAM-dependent MTase TRM10-type domain-containing protein n=1 Tax=Caenorhabditis angaria TaxID=860376 RepID=A0A9P1IGC3_9PELO|nr:unnamed protein product [Caenorhabditis angaria]
MNNLTISSTKQQQKYDNGEMRYGPGLYQFLQNPMRNKKKIHHIEGNKIYESMRANMPKIALDLQFIETMKPSHRAELGNQMQYMLSENFAAKTPLLLDFVNLPNEQFVENWMAKSIGYYGGMYCDQTILPGCTTKGRYF